MTVRILDSLGRNVQCPQLLAGLQRQQRLWESTHSGAAFCRDTEGTARAGQGQGSRNCPPASCPTAGDVTCSCPGKPLRAPAEPGCHWNELHWGAGSGLLLPGMCPGSAWMLPQFWLGWNSWGRVGSSAATARDLQGIVIPDKNQGTDTVTVTKRRAGASSEPKYLPMLFVAVPQNHPRFQHLVSCFLQHLGSPCHKDLSDFTYLQDLVRFVQSVSIMALPVLLF